jgi:hypothetical protein
MSLEIIPEDQREALSPFKNILPTDIEQYRNNIVHYFDNQMNQDILALEPIYKEKLFQMFEDYADVLEKIFHPGIPILEHILDKRWSAANAKPHAGIDYDYQCPIIAEYKHWKESKEIAAKANEQAAN